MYRYIHPKISLELIQTSLHPPGDVPPSAGPNTKMVEWLPQNDPLGHNKTRLFITHAGVNSMYEAGYHGIPVVAVSLFFDQFDNARKMEQRGIGLTVDIHTTNTKELGDAIFPFVNGRCHLKQSLPFLKQSLPFITVVAISIHASSDKNAGVNIENEGVNNENR